MKRIRIIDIITSTICLTISILMFSKQVNAQGQSISIYPPVIEIQTTPPSSPTVPIAIQNNNEEDIELEIRLIPFKTNGITGDVELHPEKTSQGFYPYYEERIQFLLDGKKTRLIRLQALESKEIELNINLSKGDPPGDFYYSVVFISSGTGPSDTSVSKIPAGIATNLLLSIGPKTQASGGIIEFTTSSFKSQGPVDFILKFHNGSKHLVSPQGSIEIKNLFGQTVGNLKILPQYVLAGADRVLVDEKQASAKNPTLTWTEKFLFGWYSAHAKVLVDENGPIIESNTYFIAFPIYFFFGLVIVIFITLSIYLRVKKKI